ncbi:glyoxalase [Kitasatospora sp. NPDC001664]
MAITTSSTTGTALRSVTLEVADTEAARTFYRAFGVDHCVDLRSSEAGSTGFRGFTLALTVAGPATVDAFFSAAVEAGATVLKPTAKSLWGYSGVVRAPDGTIWKIATSAKKGDGPAALEFDDLVLLIGVESVKATRQFYVGRGLAVARSFGGKYAEFAPAAEGSVRLALYKRRALAKDLGVPVEGEGSHRIVLGGGVESFTDPDGFAWEAGA